MQPTLIVDSVTRLDAASRGRVVIAGSHGGVYSAYLAARAGVRGVLLNDAGIGRDEAGIAGLRYLGDLGVPAAAISHRSARIGDGQDCAVRGILSHVNALAAAMGCCPGQPAREAAALLARWPDAGAAPSALAETRHRIGTSWNGGPAVWALDSASLVEPRDVGAIVVTGSHGGLLGGAPESALRIDALAALYNDAGGGIDDAGFGRLPALDRRGIAAGTVDVMRARIGDGRSTYEDGILTRVNATAAALGLRPGMPARDFVDTLIKTTLEHAR